MITLRDLRALSALGEYTDDELNILLSVAPPTSLPAGGLLGREATVGTSCFLIVLGEVEVFKTKPTGERILATVGPGSFLGQVSMVDRAPRSASMRAKTAVVALELPREVFERLLGATSPFALRFQQQIAVAAVRQLRAATDRLAAIMGPEPGASRPPSQGAPALELLQAASDEWAVSLEDANLDEMVVVKQKPPPRSPFGRGA